MEPAAKMSVGEFFSERELFITGGTGFLGKILIEKLLYSCPNLKTIYILIRQKKGVLPEERLNKFLEDIVFNRIKNTDASLLNKLKCVTGDVSQLGLGISPEDYEKLQNVSVVIHGAATIRFDEPLKESILMNTRGTREVLLLAKNLKNLKSFTHISTTFCNPDHPNTDEQLYPIHVKWQDAIKMAENIDIETLDILSKKLTDFHPNTYTFSKRLSEVMINDFKDEIPVSILRPSIVTPIIQEPMPGWVDNFNGPMGLIMASCLGIFRFCYFTNLTSLDYQPVDLVARAIILATWKTGTTDQKNLKEVAVYNSSTNGKYCMNHLEMLSSVSKYRFLLPPESCVWYPNITFTSCYFYYVFLTVIFLAIPFNIMDFVLKTLKINIKIRLSAVVRKIFYVQNSLNFFMQTQFTFNNKKCLTLQDNGLSPEEFAQFCLTPNVSRDDYLSTCLINTREFLLHEKLENLPRAQRKMVLLCILHYSIMGIAVGILSYLTYSHVIKN